MLNKFLQKKRNAFYVHKSITWFQLYNLFFFFIFLILLQIFFQRTVIKISFSIICIWFKKRRDGSNTKKIKFTCKNLFLKHFDIQRQQSHINQTGKKQTIIHYFNYLSIIKERHPTSAQNSHKADNLDSSSKQMTHFDYLYAENGPMIMLYIFFFLFFLVFGNFFKHTATFFLGFVSLR